MFDDKANVRVYFGKTCVGTFFFTGVCVLCVGDSTGRCCASYGVARDPYQENTESHQNWKNFTQSSLFHYCSRLDHSKVQRLGKGPCFQSRREENRAKSATNGCWSTSLPVFLCMWWSPTAGLCSSTWPRLCPHMLCLNSPRAILSLFFHAFAFLQTPPFLFLMTRLP